MKGMAADSVEEGRNPKRHKKHKKLCAFCASCGFFLALRFCWMLDWKILTISPLPPRPEIVPHVWISDETECQISMSRPIGSLAMWNNLFIGSDAFSGVHLPEFFSGFEE